MIVKLYSPLEFINWDKILDSASVNLEEAGYAVAVKAESKATCATIFVNFIFNQVS